MHSSYMQADCSAFAGTSSQRAWQVSLSEFAGALPNARIRMLLSPAQEPEIEADRGVLRVLLGALSTEERAERASAILADMASDRLEWCAAFVAAESSNLQV